MWYGQPAEVIELYGEYGEHMEGDVTVVEHEGKEYKRVEMEFTVTRRSAGWMALAARSVACS